MKYKRPLLILAALSLCTIVLAPRIGFGGSGISAYTMERTDTYEISDYKNIKNIDLDINLSNVEIKESDTDKIQVTYPVFNDKRLRFEVDHLDDTLSIHSKDNGPMKLSIPFVTDETKTIIQVPKGHTFEMIHTQLDMGEMTMKNITTKESNINLDMGGLKAFDTNLGVSNVKLDMGSMDVKNASFDGESTISLNMGSLEGKLKATGGTVQMELDMGSVNLELYDGHYDIKADTDLGDVKNNKSNNETRDEDYTATLDINVSMGSVDIQQ